MATASKPQSAAVYRVGIDLGTTHTVVACARLDSSEIEVFPIQQTVAAGEVAARPMLPSLRFHPAAGALASADLLLPWASDESAVLGAFARELGEQTPGRLVSSAKSWLSHQAVDRGADILPWGAPDEVTKISPLAASASYLRHVRLAWDHAHPEAPLAKQQIVLTVPASFDDGARQLTLEAARLAGLPPLLLIEEPQAAFYDWVHSHCDTLAQDLAATRRLLVCDVGGGTTDLSLIEVELVDGLPRLTRTGVGEHLVLGGDNMDLALARWIEPRLSGAAARLSAVQLAQLTQRCRAAKELLLSPDGPDHTTVTLLGSGSRLIGGARSATMSRADVDRLLVDGFFPQVPADATPQRARGGLVEFGLPYASDAAITRHVAAFLARQPGAAHEKLPDTLLLNGGVFHALPLRQRLLDTLNGWAADGAPPIRLLETVQLDAAVARGAVAYAMARDGATPRIAGGSARSYFLLLDGDKAQQAGKPPRGVCLLPHGAEEGQPVQLHAQRFSLRLGRPVRFHLASSVVEVGSRPGDVIALPPGDFILLPPIATVLNDRGASEDTSNAAASREVLVELSTMVTEVGTLEMSCVAIDAPQQRWRLEFQLRGEPEDSGAEAARPPHPRLKDAVEAIGRVYGNRKQQVDAKEVRQLRAHLERLLGNRAGWDTPLLRALFTALFDGARRRRRSALHERLWFNLVGFTLRPGYGDPLDEWRIAQMWELFGPGIAHSNESQQWSEWWTLWRRIAGGLSAEQQEMVYDVIAYYLQPPGGSDIEEPEGPAMDGLDDMLRMAASFERLDVARKLQFGGWLLQRLRNPKENPHSWWALGRLGARQPMYASLHHVVPPEQVQPWLESLLGQDWTTVEPAAFAAAQIARATGDRARDLPESIRKQVADRLDAARAAPSWAAMVREVTVLDEADTRRVFGESLPPGLRLVTTESVSASQPLKS
ncbi:Hsp70 family protein [Piscinibacter sakaiensis]|uniref:Hsp70 family protein n=1 Tax=Piscinibacter sakaiensis TaxID=1547922 RepID=UPI003AAF7C4B